MEYWSIGVMEYWKEEKTAAFPTSVPPLAGLRRTGAKASAFVATLTSVDKTAWQGRQDQEKWKNGVLEHWSDGVLERGEDTRLRPFDKLRAAAWRGRQENSPGMLEEWNDGGKEIPPGLPSKKGGDKSKRGDKNEGRLMSSHSRKEGSIGKAGENWGT